MIRPNLFDRMLKLLEPERNNNKQRITYLENRLEKIEEHLGQIVVFAKSSAAPDPVQMNIIEQQPYCGHCTQYVYNAHECPLGDCPLGLHHEPEL